MWSLAHDFSKDVFGSFMHGNTSFKSDLCQDVKGVLSLYEASQLGFEGESIMDEARAFSCGHLKAILEQVDTKLAHLVHHSLEMPLHRRMLRLEARWYIDVYEKEEGMNPTLLELAKLDFNMVQAIHQSDLKKMSRWWMDLGLAEKLSFARDRLMENFFWTIGVVFYPKFSNGREGLTKVNALITTIDDVYDIYGSLDELEHFTDAVDRWDIRAMDQLPDYMKTCFLALYNTTNGMAYNILKQQDHDAIQYLQKSWSDLCKSYLVEAKWYHSGYTPTLEEYLENAWTSISGPVILVHLYFIVGQKITRESLQLLENNPKIIRWSSMILRLCDDLGTSSAELERGDVPKSVQCYMKQANVSEEIAREYIRDLITDTWKKLNMECAAASSHFPQAFINTCLDLARMSQCMYQFGDGHGVPAKKANQGAVCMSFSNPTTCCIDGRFLGDSAVHRYPTLRLSTMTLTEPPSFGSIALTPGLSFTQTSHPTNHFFRTCFTGHQLQQHHPEAVHVRFRATSVRFRRVVPDTKIGNPRVEFIVEEDIRRGKVAMNDGLGASMVKEGEATCDPYGDLMPSYPTHFLGRDFRGFVLFLPRVHAPVFHVGFSGWQLVKPLVKIAVGHELVQQELFLACRNR